MILPFDYIGYKRLSENKRLPNHRWYSDATWRGNGWMSSIASLAIDINVSLNLKQGQKYFCVFSTPCLYIGKSKTMFKYEIMYQIQYYWNKKAARIEYNVFFNGYGLQQSTNAENKPVISNTGNFFCSHSNVSNLYNNDISCHDICSVMQ